VVPFPGEDMLLSFRNESVYPGKVNEFVAAGGAHYVNPLEGFTNEDLRLRFERLRAGTSRPSSDLYNRHLAGDNHFSPKGCALWAEIVGERLLLVRELEHARANALPTQRPTSAAMSR
jgi:hypothetical protein